MLLRRSAVVALLPFGLWLAFAACGDDASSSDGANLDGGSPEAALGDGAGGPGSGDGAGAENPASRGGPAAPKSGTRIQHQRWQTADGAEIAGGLLDTKLGVACSPQFLTDDQLHCVPES